MKSTKIKTSGIVINGRKYTYGEMSQVLRGMGYKVDGRKKSHRGTVARLKYQFKKKEIDGYTFKRAKKSILKNSEGWLSKRAKTPRGALVKLPPGSKKFKFTKDGYKYVVGDIQYQVHGLDKSAFVKDPSAFKEVIQMDKIAGALIQVEGDIGKITYTKDRFEDYFNDDLKQIAGRGDNAVISVRTYRKAGKK